jgi:hypothetical protein
LNTLFPKESEALPYIGDMLRDRRNLFRFSGVQPAT